MPNYTKHFIVKPGDLSSLDDSDSASHKGFENHKDAVAEMKHLLDRMAVLQEKLYAGKRSSLLVVLQGLDAAGKDGVVRHVLTGLNPAGVNVTSFKQPTDAERAHDFLWRVHPHAPAKGEIAIFNRSHYEDVLVARVHKLIPPPVWKQRFDLINNFERLLAVENETVILKFFLHISPVEQLARFKVRLDEPDHEWKISESDYSERELWDAYTEAFEETISRTSTDVAPWFVIPSDHKWFRDLAISQIIVRALEGMKLAAPKPGVDIKAVRREFEKAEKKLSKKDREKVEKTAEKKEKSKPESTGKTTAGK